MVRRGRFESVKGVCRNCLQIARLVCPCSKRLSRGHLRGTLDVRTTFARGPALGLVEPPSLIPELSLPPRGQGLRVLKCLSLLTTARGGRHPLSGATMLLGAWHVRSSTRAVGSGHGSLCRVRAACTASGEWPVSRCSAGASAGLPPSCTRSSRATTTRSCSAGPSTRAPLPTGSRSSLRRPLPRARLRAGGGR